VKQLLIVGSGGFGREALEAVRAINRCDETWKVLGFLDDDANLHGTIVDGVKVLGPISAVQHYPDAQLIVTIGNPDDFTTRHRIVTGLGLPDTRYAVVVHPGASIPPGSTVGRGTVILDGVVATTPVVIGAHVVIMPGVVLTHDDVVASFATLASGVRLAGSVTIGEGAYIGAGALVRERLHIGPWALVGMGAGVAADVPSGEVWAGLPARYLRPVRVLPAHLRGNPAPDAAPSPGERRRS
jgi:sugar O-acyltransferase (sialic acid O-acetyltransferase NeuD family)